MRKTNFLAGILLAVIGLLMIIMPRGFIKAAVILLGIEAVVNGVYTLVYTRKFISEASVQFTIICRSMLSIVIGLLAFFLPLVVADVMWTVMLYVLAVYLLADAVLELYAIGKLRDAGVERRYFIREAVISIVVAVILFIIPAKIGTLIVRICGLILLILGASYSFYEWNSRPILQEHVEVVDDISGTID